MVREIGEVEEVTPFEEVKLKRKWGVHNRQKWGKRRDSPMKQKLAVLLLGQVLVRC